MVTKDGLKAELKRLQAVSAASAAAHDAAVIVSRAAQERTDALNAQLKSDLAAVERVKDRLAALPYLDEARALNAEQQAQLLAMLDREVDYDIGLYKLGLVRADVTRGRVFVSRRYYLTVKGRLFAIALREWPMQEGDNV